MDEDTVISDGGGSKRAGEMEAAIDDAGGEVVTVKRRRKEEVKRSEDGDEEIKRVAEIVLVLSAMGRMRGGRDPTVTEKAMMAEARAKVVALCEELAPKDILPTDDIGVVIEDLGLNRLKDRLGFRPPKISISDKIALTKRRMEESKVFATQPASLPSQRVQTGSGIVVENRGTPPTVCVFPSDKVGHMPVPAGTFQPPAPVVNVSSAASTPMRYPPGTDVRPTVVSTSVVPTRHDRAHIKPEVRPNSPSLPHIPVSSTVNQHILRTTPVQLQPQAPLQANVGTKNIVPDQLSVRVDSNVSSSAPHMAAQAAVAPMPGTVASQPTVALCSMQHPVQGMQFVHSPLAVNHHLEISRLVQKLLAPKLPQRSVWTPPSRDYMNRTIPCQFCKLVISEVENMVVCDACEKGFHLGCLQSYNAKSFPRGEWHCPRCLAMSHGKPFPPKYGRVTRNMNVMKVPSNTVGVQLPPEKKVGIVDEKVKQPNAMTDKIQDFKPLFHVNQPNATTNGNHDSKIHTQAVKVIKPSFQSILQDRNETDKNDRALDVKEGVPKKEECLDNTTGATVGAASLSTSAVPSVNNPPQQVKCEISSCDNRLISEAESTTVTSQANNKLGNLPASSNQNEADQKVLDGVGIPEHQNSDSNGISDSRQCNENANDNKVAMQKNLFGIDRVHEQAEDVAEASESGLHDVDWLGDVERIVDENKFFRSCRINGMVYQLQDYALIRSKKGKLIPLKLQAMWEDSLTSSKWLGVHKCYFPDQLPEEVGRPGAPQSNEVYESTHDSKVLAGFVQGPCEVLPFRNFGEETENHDQGSQGNDRKKPVFIRNWFYDETRQAFCPNAC